MKRFSWLGLVLGLFLICTSCGDTFRPVIIPNTPQFPDPRAAHTVFALNNNETNAGTGLVVDVSGDTEVSAANIGISPVHAVQQSASQVLVVNSPDPTQAADSLTKVLFSGVSISSATSITLPPGSGPTFVATTESNTAYVTLPNFVPPSIGVVNTVSNTLTATIPVGTNPVALAETPDGKKLYVANAGSGTVSAFNTVDRSVRTVNGALSMSSAPIWLVARGDSQRVYVLEHDGILAFIDTSSTAGPDTLTETSIVSTGASQLVYDARLNRLYIPFLNQVQIVDVSQSTPQLLVTVTIPNVPASGRSAGDPCATTTASSPLHAVAAAALPDESRAYVGAYYLDNVGNICSQVTAINASSNTVKKSVPVPGVSSVTAGTVCATTPFRLSMAAAGDSSRVYLSTCDGGNVNIVRTSDDTFVISLLAPPSLRTPIPPATQPPPQSPVFLIAGP